MVNEKDKALREGIEKIFDLSAVALNEMADEIQTLEAKFGTQSIIVKKKREQYLKMRSLYDKTLEYINFLRNLNHQMYESFTAWQLMHNVKKSGLPFANVAKLAGWDPVEWEKIDRIDAVIEKAKKLLKYDEDKLAFIDDLRNNNR